MKQLLAVLFVSGSAFVFGGCANTANTDPNATPKIDLDTKVYNTGSRIGRPDRGYETPSAAANPSAPAPAAPAPSK